MKKKFIQILVLLVAAVSTGSLVSCKDTNEDLYNELRTELLNEINENTTLANALNQRISQLESKLQSLEAWKAEMENWKQSINSCSCPSDVQGLINGLNDEIRKINEYIKILGDPKALDFYTKAEIDAKILTLTNMINNINDIIATLAKASDLDAFKEKTDNALNTINEKIEELEKALEDAKCECNPANFQEVLDRLTELEKGMVIAETDIKQALDDAKVAKETAQNAITIANAANDAAQQAIGLATTASGNAANAIDIANNAINIANGANARATDALTLAQANDEAIKKLREEFQNKTQELSDAIKSNSDKLKELDEQVKADAEKIASNAEKIQQNAEAIEKLQTEIATKIANLQTEVSNASKAANQALADAADAKYKADTNSVRIEELTKRVENNETNIKNLQVSLEALTTTVSGLKDQADSNTKKIEELEKALETTNNNVSDLSDKYTKLADEVNNLKDQLAKCQETCKQNLEDAKKAIEEEINKLREELEDRIDANESRITANELTIGELKKVVATLQTDVSDLQKRIDEAEKTLAELVNTVEKLTTDVEVIQNYLSKQVTSILIQGTHNPLFGSISIPGTNFMSTSLIAFYGLPSSDVEFPTSDDANYVRKNEVLTDMDMEMLGNLQPFEAPANLPLLNEGGNAGKVYVTINPNTADLSGLQLSIVNSLDEESPIKLSPIKKSEDKLQSGWTRANNGFYVAEASITPKAVMTADNGVYVSKESVTNLFKNVKEELGNLAEGHNAGQIGLSQLATDVYGVLTNMKVDRSGLKCTYTTTEADGTQKEHSVYSRYDLAGTFLNPLNLKWGKDFNFVKIPGYDAANRLLDKFTSTLKNGVSTIFDKANQSGLLKQIVNFEIKSIQLGDLKDETIQKFKITISEKVVIDGLTYDMELPADAVVDVKFAKGVTLNGSSISIPADMTIDTDNPSTKSATLVVYDDITTSNVPLKLLVKAARAGEVKYIWYDLTEGAVKTNSNLKANGADYNLTLDGQDVAIFKAIAGNYEYTSINDYIKLSETINVTTGEKPSLDIEFSYDLSNEMKEIWGNTQGAIENVNEMLDSIKAILAELNESLDNINKYKGLINDKIDWIAEQYLSKFLDKINNSVVSMVNGINYRLGPLMVASNTDKGFKCLSGSKGYPTVLSANGLSLYPTTRNMELIVPLARKHVAVTNVFKGNASAQGGNTDCKARLQAVNAGENMNTVIDGTVRKIDLSNMVAGYVYEFAYSVLDFEGNISTQKYYITIR